MQRNIGAAYVDWSAPIGEVRLTPAQRIRLHQHTEREVDVARQAVRFYRKAGEAPVRAEYDGSPRYQGRTAIEVVEKAIQDPVRQRLVLHLVVAMAEDRGFYVGTRDKKAPAGVNQHSEG